jgi:pyridoxine 5-phosphate synthase
MPIPKLGVNIDHVATVRQARRTYEPDPVAAAVLATLAGAEIITCHLREDRRHIQDRDVRLLRDTVFTKLNLEMACTPGIVAIALDTGPEQATLVPEKREEITTEGGLDVAGAGPSLAKTVARLKKSGILVSLFVDADLGQIRASAECGADAVELHTGPYANAKGEPAQRKRLDALLRAADEARRLGLSVNAGHGLTYMNVRALVAALEVEELHIGHSIVARAVLAGMEQAVREMCELIARYSKRS